MRGKPTNGVLVLVRVDADEDDLAVQLVHDGEEHVRRDHAVQRPDEHSLLRVKTIPRVLNVRRVRHHPRYDLNGLSSFSAITDTTIDPRASLELGWAAINLSLYSQTILTILRLLRLCST